MMRRAATVFVKKREGFGREGCLVQDVREGAETEQAAFGDLLRQFRAAAHLSQEMLAERARMSPGGISLLERGMRRAPYRGTVALLAEGLGLSEADRARLEASAREAQSRRLHVSAAGQTPDSPSHNLPFGLTRLIGREREVSDIVALLSQAPLATVVGAGGIGKTRVVMRVATDVLADFDGGVWFVDLGSIRDTSCVVDRVARTLSLPDVADRPLGEALLGFLKQRSLVLILDNCEHVIADCAALVSDIVRSCPRVRILATSREPLKVANERVYRLQPLRVPLLGESHTLSAAEAAAFAAIGLFVERAQAGDYQFALTDENAPVIAEICRRLDGIPLAIELAAARIGILSPNALAERLDVRFAILAGRDRQALPRQQTMRALIDWSYDLLSPQEQRLFERLSVFAGSCSLASASSVCREDGVDEPEMLELMVSLVDKSLVVADVGGDEPRYALLESSRTYAAEKLVARGEGSLIAHRHARAALELARRIELDCETTPDPKSPALIESELENWRAALEWTLVGRGDIELGQRLAAALRPVWVGAGNSSVSAAEGRRWVKMAVDLVDNSTPLDVVAGLHYADGTIAVRSSKVELGLEINNRALASYRELGDKRSIAGVQRNIGRALLALGRPSEAEVHFREALDAARALGMRWLEGAVLTVMAIARSQAGDMVKARAYCGEAVAIFRADGDELNAAIALGNLAEGEFGAGNVDLAVRLGAESLAVYHTGDQSSEQVLANMAAYLIATDRYDEARAYAWEATELARERQQSVATAWALQHLATIAALRPSENVEKSRMSRAQGARLIGFVDARLAALGAPRQYTEQQEYVRVTTMLRGAVDPAEFESLMRIGAMMTEDQAIEQALAAFRN